MTNSYCNNEKCEVNGHIQSGCTQFYACQEQNVDGKITNVPVMKNGKQKVESFVGPSLEAAIVGKNDTVTFTGRADGLTLSKSGDSPEIENPVENSPIYTIKEFEISGIGVPPIVELAKVLSGHGKEERPIASSLVCVIGYRNADTFLLEELQQYAKVIVATEDGSIGTKGNVIDAMVANNINPEVIFACGPMPMLKGIKNFAEPKNIKAYISLEERYVGLNGIVWT